MRAFRRWLAIGLFVFVQAAVAQQDETIELEPVRFAVIGDFGTNDDPMKEVARMVKGWKPDFIITVGDNSYIDGEKGKSGFERAVVDHFDDFVESRKDDPLAEKTRFFPSLGNHDYEADGHGVEAGRLADYEAAFALPPGEGGIHYYEFARGPVRFFALDSNTNSAWSGSKTTSRQYAWWKKAVARAKEKWKIVYFHHTPYISGIRHRRDRQMRAWQLERHVSAVIAGHEHVYERVMIDDVPFFTMGLGGRHLHGFRRPFVVGSAMRYPESGDPTPREKRFGAMLAEATTTTLTFETWNIDGKLVERWPRDAAPLDTKPGLLPLTLP